MAIRGTPKPRNFDTNMSALHIRGDETRESSTSQTTSRTLINKPFPYMDSGVWEWFITRGLYNSARSLGEATAHVAESFDIGEERLRIHFSYDGQHRYAIVVRIPVEGTGSQRFERMGAVEEGFYGELQESLGALEEFAWLKDEVSLAFLPG